MTDFDLHHSGSDRLDLGGLAAHEGPKVDMTDKNIRDIFRPPTPESGVLEGNHLHFSSPYPQDELSNRLQFNRGADATAGQGTINRCDVAPTTPDTTTGASGSDAFIQQLSQSDPKLATMLTDAQGQMSPTAAAQLEANVSNNFSQNNGQFQTDSSLMNASISQMNDQGVSTGDVTAAQNSVTKDLADPNIGDCTVSTATSPASSSDGGSSAPANSCDSSSGSSSPSSSSDSSSQVQQDLSQLMQDLQSGNIQQFWQDLMKDLPDIMSLLGSTPPSSGSDTGGSTTPPTTSDAPAQTTDGTTPSANPTNPATTGTLNPLGQQLANSIVKNDGTAQASTVAQVQQTLEYGTPQSVLQALQKNGTQITVTGTDIGSGGMNNGSNFIEISDNPNDTPPGLIGEVTAHEASEIWSTSTGFTNSQAFQNAAQKDLAALPAGSLNNLPIQLVDGPTMTAADGTQVGMTDVASEIATNIAANQTGDTSQTSTGEGATLAQLFPDVYALEQQAMA